MTEVIKRDKRRESFSAEKVRRSIESAAREANVAEERAKEIVEKVSRKVTAMAEQGSEIETRAIREAILNELDTLEPRVSEAWRKFDETKSTQ